MFVLCGGPGGSRHLLFSRASPQIAVNVPSSATCGRKEAVKLFEVLLQRLNPARDPQWRSGVAGGPFSLIPGAAHPRNLTDYRYCRNFR